MQKQLRRNRDCGPAIPTAARRTENCNVKVLSTITRNASNQVSLDPLNLIGKRSQTKHIKADHLPQPKQNEIKSLTRKPDLIESTKQTKDKLFQPTSMKNYFRKRQYRSRPPLTFQQTLMKRSEHAAAAQRPLTTYGCPLQINRSEHTVFLPFVGPVKI